LYFTSSSPMIHFLFDVRLLKITLELYLMVIMFASISAEYFHFLLPFMEFVIATMI
jgi:hypothetical protein